MKKAGFLCYIILLFSISQAQTPAQKFLQDVKRANPDYYSGFKGEFIVSEQGAAIYNIPIFTSPGVGMEPKISLLYNSNNGTSILGEGWALSGLSFIGRSAATYSQDGFVNPINFDQNDKLHLDGQRLTLLDKTNEYGSQNSHYRTENNSFKDIEIIEGDLNPNSNSLRSLIVKSKDGLIYRYGNSNTGLSDGVVFSKVKLPSGSMEDIPILWLLKSVIDRNGNWINFDYEINQNSYYPKTITYGKAKDEEPVGLVEFGYKQTPWWTNKKFINGQEIILNKYLNEIRCNYAFKQGGISNLALVRKYSIAYKEDKDFEKIYIDQIFQSYRQDVAIDNVKLPANDIVNKILFDSRTPSLDSNRINPAYKIQEKGFFDERQKIVIGDYNGDGYPDRALIINQKSNIELSYSENDKMGGFHNCKKYQFPEVLPNDYKLFSGDYNADGLIDILLTYYAGDDLQGLILYQDTHGSGSIFKVSKTLSLGSFTGIEKKKIFVILGEFNGDGFSDILAYYITDSIKYFPVVFQKNFSLKKYNPPALPKYDIPNDSHLFFNDLNGDGLSDFLFSWTTTEGWFVRSYLFKDSRAFGIFSNQDKINLHVDTSNKPIENTYIGHAQSNNGQLDSTVRRSSVTISNGDYSKLQNIFIIDLNKDGNADIIISKADKNGWYCYPSLGKGNGEFQAVNINNKILLSSEVFNNDLKTSFGDFNGDGNLDLIIQYSNSHGWFYNIAYGNGKGKFFCTNKKTDTKMELLSKENFSYSSRIPSTAILPIYCPYYPIIAREIHEDDPNPGSTAGYYSYLNSFRRGRYVETGYFPNSVITPYINEGFSCLTKLFIGSVDYEKNIKQVESVLPVGDSIVRPPETTTGFPSSFPYSYYAKVTYMDYWQSFVVDFNADGVSDLILTYPNNPPSDSSLHVSFDSLTNHLVTFIAINKSERAGFLKTVRLSNKNTIVIKYGSSLIDDRGFSMNGISYPSLKLTNPIVCVSDVGISNGLGINKYSHTRYRYSNGIFNVLGRGFLGFLSTEIENVNTGTHLIKQYYNSFDYLSKGLLMLKSSNLYVNKVPIPIEEESYNYEIQSSLSNDIFSIYTSTISHHSMDLYGQMLSKKQTSIKNDNFGNAIEITEIEGSPGLGYRKRKTENSYWESSMPILQDNWILGRLKDSKITINDIDVSQSRFEYYLSINDEGSLVGSGQLKKEVSFVGNNKFSVTKEYKLNNFGNIDTSITYPTTNLLDKRVTITKYSSDQRFVLSVTNPEGYISTQRFNSESGFLEMKSDFDASIKTLYFSDPLGRKSLISTPDTITTKNEMRLCRNCEIPDASTITIQESNISTLPQVNYYDCAGRLIRKVSFDVSGIKKITTDYRYDAEGNLIKLSNPFFVKDNQVWTTFKYDLLKRQVEMKLPDFSITQHNYFGLFDTLIDAKGKKFITKRNLLGYVDSTIDNNKYAISYQYDPFGKITSISDNDKAIAVYKYDDIGNKVYYLSANFRRPMIYDFDCWGKLKQTIDPNNSKIVYLYDKIGRIVKKIVERDVIEYKYVKQNSPSFGKGKILSIESSSNKDHLINEYFQYSNTAKVKTHSYLIKPGSSLFDTKNPAKNTLIYSFVYVQGQLSSITYPYTGLAEDVRFKVNYVYQNGTMVKSNCEYGNSKIQPKIYELLESNAFGSTTKYRLGDSIICTQSFDKFTQRLDSLEYEKNKITVSGLRYSYDQIGNLVSRSEMNTQNRDSVFYDDINRITKVSTNGYDVKVDYYSNGDIKLKSYGNDYKLLFDYQKKTNKFNKIYQYVGLKDKTPTGFDLSNSYDASGNLKSTFPCINRYNQEEVVFNEYNLPKQIGLHTFNYDYGNIKQLVARDNDLYLSLGGLSDFYYDLDNEEKPFRYQKFNILVNDSPVAYFYSNDKSIHYLLKDAQNTVVAEVTRRGKTETIERYSYDIWGLKRNPTSWKYTWTAIANQYNKANNKGFLNSMTLEGFGLVDMNARMYDPIAGRFISIDPLLTVSFPSNQIFNSYLYGINNPAKYRDSNGKIFGIDDFIVIVVVGAYIGASASGGSLLPWQWNENWWKGALIGGASAAGGYYLAGAYATSGPIVSSITGGFGAGFASSFTSTIVNGGNFGDALLNGMSSGIIGGVTGAFTGFIGHGIPGLQNPESFSSQYFIKAGAHGLTQGMFSEAMGGKFEHGFMAGAASEFVQPVYKTLGSLGSGGRTAFSAIVGGSVSSLGGGKFANGAMSAAFVQMFNHEQQDLKEEVDLSQKKNEMTVEGFKTLSSSIGAVEPKFLEAFGHLNTASSAAISAYEVVYNHESAAMVLTCGGVNLFISSALAPEITPFGSFVVGSAAETACKYVWPQSNK